MAESKAAWSQAPFPGDLHDSAMLHGTQTQDTEQLYKAELSAECIRMPCPAVKLLGITCSPTFC